MLKKTFALLIGLTMLISLTLVGCEAPTETDPTDTDPTDTPDETTDRPFEGREMSFLIGSVTMTDAYYELLDDFEEATGISVDLQVVPGDSQSYDQLVQAQIATQTYTDIIVYISGPRYVNALMPEENVIEITDEEILGRIKDGIMDLGGTKDGKIYGIPFGGIDFTGLLCNMNIFEDLDLTPPEDYDELVAVGEAVLAADENIVPLYEMGRQGGPLNAFIFTDTTEAFFEDPDITERINTGQVRFEDTFILDSLERKMALQDKGFFNDDLMSGTWDTMFSALANNEFAMTFMYSNVLPMLYENYPEANVKMVPLNDTVAATFIQATYVMDTENQDLAFEFLRYYTESSTLNVLHNKLRAVSPYKDVEKEIDPALDTMVEVLNRGRTAPNIFDHMIVGIGQVPVFQDMHRGELTPLEAAVRMSDQFHENARDMGIPGFND